MKKLTEVKLRITAKTYQELVRKMLDNNQRWGMYFDYIIQLDHGGKYMAFYEIDILSTLNKNKGAVYLGE